MEILFQRSRLDIKNTDVVSPCKHVSVLPSKAQTMYILPTEANFEILLEICELKVIHKSSKYQFN